MSNSEQYRAMKAQVPMTVAEGRTLAQQLGLQLGGAGCAFEGNYGVKGLYAYNAGKYKGMAFFGTGGTPEQMRQPTKNSEQYRPMKAQVPMTVAEGRTLAQQLGLQLGGAGCAFEGNYGVKGLYAYNAGKYKGMAFFGTGGTPEQMRQPTKNSEQYRPMKAQVPNLPMKAQVPMTVAEGRTLAQQLGLQLGGAGCAFEGNYGVKGLYAYNAGKYKGMAFFGTGGTPEQMRLPTKNSEQYRPSV